MILTEVAVQRFRNFVDRQVVPIEEDVTCLVGKNESGKTTLLVALHRVNPANLTESHFDLTTEYPRWRLARDRRAQELEKVQPISVAYRLEEKDLDACATFFPARPPEGTTCTYQRDYSNGGFIGLHCAIETVLRAAGHDAGLGDEDLEAVSAATTKDAALAIAKDRAKSLREEGEAGRAKGLTAFATSLEAYSYLLGLGTDDGQRKQLVALLPKYFYFSEYELLPGQLDLNVLAEKVEAKTALTPGESNVLALLRYAGAEPADFLGDNYDQRKAELQSAALDLSQKVFTYWTQSSDLEVEFDTELEQVEMRTNGVPVMHRMLKILMRDNRHGGIVTNFETRSAGFRWFFSFLAAFSEYQSATEPIIVLLDEPGTSLHGEAQKDFVRFIFQELGTSKQVIYTTHSQHMIDPARYEKLRAVEDRSIKSDPDRGVAVSLVSLSADRDTLLPVQAALGYSISQHLFIGAGRNLVVEGGSDYVYLQRLSEHLLKTGRTGLDVSLRILPVGSASIIPAFVALIGRDLDVSVLLDGDKRSKDAQRVFSQVAGGVIAEREVVVIADVPGVAASKPDIEDVFATVDYLRLFNWAFGTAVTEGQLPATNERIVQRLEAVHGVYDHAVPAHSLTQHRDEFFASIATETEDRFAALFELLNATAR